MSRYSRSAQYYEEASNVLVGGVNSPVRAFKSVGGAPVFMNNGQGAHIFDVDGNAYLDYVGSYGPLILGHCHPEVSSTIVEAVEKGTTFGAGTIGEVRLAKKVQEAFPFVEKVRFVNSGTEALMSIIRLMRAATGRNKIIKFAGCYHGHSDALLAESGSGLATLSLPGSAGVPEHIVADTIILPFNDFDSVQRAFEHSPGQIAGILVEPVPGNMGVVLPEKDYLRSLKEICDREGALLVFDEVMSGFRQNFGGVAKSLGVIPHLTTLGKVIGGGMPVGAYGGPAEIMDLVAPVGPVYQAGTLSGNPVAMAAGLATLEVLSRTTELYDELNKRSQSLAQGMQQIAHRLGVDMVVNRYGSMVCPFFTAGPIRNYAEAKSADTVKFSKFFWSFMNRGQYIPPSQFESWFVSTMHSAEDIENTLQAFEDSLKEIAD